MLDNSLQTKLLTQLVSRYQDDNPARFYAGRGADKKQINTICGDVIDWLDEADSINQDYLALIETLRMGLNRALYLGLFDYESHYAIYGAGAGYTKHSDVPVGKKIGY